MTRRDERYILFRSAGVRWAISASGVAEVLPTSLLERPAGSPRALAGFLNLGGAPLAVIRLAALFGMSDPAEDDLYHHVLRLAAAPGATPVGLMVERVTDVDAHAERMAPLSEGQSVNDALMGNLVIGEEMVPLLDWGRLLLMEERQRIDELAAATRARLADLEKAEP